MERFQTFLQKWRVRLGHLFAVAILIFAQPQLRFLIIGTVVSLAGEGIRIISAGTISKDEILSRSGPYAYVRNPLYFGSFLMSLGFCVASANYYILAAFPLFFFPVYYATIFREEAFLRTRFGEKFEEFRREVPRFVPRLTPARGGAGSEFSWTQVSRNREYEGLAAMIAILALMWIMWATRWSIAGLIGIGR